MTRVLATTSATGDARYQVIDLHGDVATTLDATLLPPGFNRFDEFGVPISGQQALRYGWLGGKQRSAEANGSVILMGVRLYHPDTGRFLQPDPVDGGSCNSYEYACADPINAYDLDGKRCWRGFGWACRTVGPKVRSRWLGGLASRAVRKHSRFPWKSAQYLYNHINVSAGFCPWKCIGVGFQGGTFYAYGGQNGLATPGVALGWTSRAGWKRESGCTGAGAGIKWGAYGCVGRTGGGGYNWRDVEVGGVFRPGGVWWGTQRSYHTWSPRWLQWR